MLDLSRLTPAQRAAVLANDGPLVVVAGPGSGKTTVLAARIAYLISARGAPPASVLALTFATRAARELRLRLCGLLGPAGRQVDVATFHAFGLRLLRRWSDVLGWGPGPLVVYGAAEARSLVGELATTLGLDPGIYPPGELATRVERYRLSGWAGEAVTSRGTGPPGSAHSGGAATSPDADLVPELAERYEALLRQRGAVDYAAMLALPSRLCDARPDALRALQEAYGYVLCDEAQDVCRTQYGLLRRLAARHHNLTLVGDPMQCLPAGTPVRTPGGDVPIERLRPGDLVTAATGHGRAGAAAVDDVLSRPFAGDLVRVTLKSGRILRLTPDHTCFARPGSRPADHAHDESRRPPWAALRVWLDSSHRSTEYEVQRPGEVARTGGRVSAGTSTGVGREAADAAAAESFARGAAGFADGTEVARWAQLTRNATFAFRPAARLYPATIVPVLQDDGIGEDEVVAVDREPYDGPVFDLNVGRLHNYVACGVVVHNCIYGWRGADAGLMLHLAHDFPGARTVRLEHTFRATGHLVELANALGAGLPYGQRLRTDNPPGEAGRLHVAADEQREADFVAAEVARLCAEGRLRRPGEAGVLFRTNRQAHPVVLALRRRRVPYRVQGGADLFARREVRDAVAYLRLAHNPDDRAALARVVNVPPRRLARAAAALRTTPGAVSLPDLPALAAPDGPAATAAARGLVVLVEALHAGSRDRSPADLLTAALDGSGYRAWLAGQPDAAGREAGLAALVALARQGDGEGGLGAWLADLQLGEDVAAGPEAAERLLLTTVHGAKGGEWRVVFVLGMEEGLLPHWRALALPAGEAAAGRSRAGAGGSGGVQGVEEELRLAYVAVTRAREALYLSHCRARRRGDRVEPRLPSRFLRGLPLAAIPGPPAAGLAPSASSAHGAGRHGTGGLDGADGADGVDGTGGPRCP
jgi:superfamily I DNA/RNA helicase